MEFTRLLEKAKEYLPPEKLPVLEEAYKFAVGKTPGAGASFRRPVYGASPPDGLYPGGTAA